MAKWDLSKLPEGRKPLPDEWFRERAQMQERIAELEAKLTGAEEMLEREIRRVQKIQQDLPPPHKVDLVYVEAEYRLMLAELKGEPHGDDA